MGITFVNLGWIYVIVVWRFFVFKFVLILNDEDKIMSLIFEFFWDFENKFMNFFGFVYEGDEFFGLEDEDDEGGRWMLTFLK